MDMQPLKKRRLNHTPLENSNGETSTSKLANNSTPSSNPAEASSLNGHGNLAKSVPSIVRPSRSGLVRSMDNSIHADLFKLQRDELLGRLRPRYETKLASADREVHKLQAVISAIPDRDALLAPEAWKAFKESDNIDVPFPKPVALGSKLQLAYSKPTDIGIVGSYARKTALLKDSNVTIDLAIRIILAVKDDVFPLEKILPTKSCIRDTAAEGDHPTPRYNATLRSECCSALYVKLLHQSTVRSNALQDACMLGALWLRQRGLGASISAGGFGQFEWATLISLLMRDGGRAGRPILSNGYSSYQLFKATLQFLSSTDLIVSPMFIQSPSFKFVHTKNPMLFDGSRGMNVLYKMSSWSYQLLRNEARNSLKGLNDPLADHFRILFINKVDEPLKRFDHYFRVPIKKPETETSATKFEPDLAEMLHERFCYGLGSRATLVYPQILGTSIWPVDSPAPHPDDSPGTSVGLLLDPEHCQRTVDRGPPIEDKAASAVFQKFWGDKAELRRFKDGTILESVIWDNPGSSRSVIDSIISHILNRHFGLIDQTSRSGSSEAFARFLPQQRSSQSDMLEPFKDVMSSFESLCKSIRAMEGLPLQIRQIFAVSPQLR
ncbi:MAG: hypothetical protein Q9204_006564, partial [Flavoplaca sp. TL-2023a]